MAFEMNRFIAIALLLLIALPTHGQPLRRLSHRWWRPRALIAMTATRIRHLFLMKLFGARNLSLNSAI